MRRRTPIQNRKARRARSKSCAIRIRPIARGLALSFLLITPSVWADEPRKRGVEEIEVIGRGDNPYAVDESTLSKFPGSLQDAPQSITIIPKNLIQDQNATTLRDALRNVSGIGLSAGEGGAQGDDFTLRGYSAKSDIFIDGVRDQGSYFRDSFNLEAVEVFKGPTSSFFGRGSTGGVVNQVSKSPRLDPAYSGVLSGGNGAYFRGAADVNQPLGETTALRVNLMAQDSEVVDRDEIETDRRGLALSLATGIGTSTQWTLSHLFQKEDNVPDYGLPYIDGKPARVDRDTFFGTDGDFEKTKVNVTTLRLDHEWSDSLSLRSTLRYSHVDRAAAPTAPRPCAAGATQCPQAMMDGIRRGRPERDAVETIFSQQTDVTARFETGPLAHTLTTGLELSRETFDLTRFNNSGPFSIGLDPDAIDTNVLPVPRTRSVRSKTTALGVGVFAADTIEITRQLDLVLGLRWDTFNTRFEDELPRTDGTTGPDFKNKDRNLSYRVGLVLKPTPTQSYYVSYGTSFNPSAESLSLSMENEGTDPEKNRSIELGAKLALLAGSLNLQGAVFQIDKTDARETDQAQGLALLDGEQRVRGFEVSVIGRLLPGWNMFAGYTFLDGETRDSRFTPANIGNELQRVPRHSATLWTTARMPGDRMEIGGGPTYVSHRFSNAANTNKVDGYVRWDAMVSYQLTENVELRLNVQNVGDAEIFESAGGGHAVPAPGRTFIVSSSFSF